MKDVVAFVVQHVHVERVLWSLDGLQSATRFNGEPEQHTGQPVWSYYHRQQC
uniref:Uncharacterized protein n=1 Tax=Hyaloperonospora arabidopsidis (strain Emoy2) TaxID=559515 RepID=M4BHV2_HYAAE